MSTQNKYAEKQHRIVIVGGGAGGLSRPRVWVTTGKKE